MKGPIIALLLAALMVNGVLLFISSQEYMEFVIKHRFFLRYYILKRNGDLRKAEDAGAIAEEIVRWFRPTVLILGNAFICYLAVKTFTSLAK